VCGCLWGCDIYGVIARPCVPMFTRSGCLTDCDFRLSFPFGCMRSVCMRCFYVVCGCSVSLFMRSVWFPYCHWCCSPSFVCGRGGISVHRVFSSEIGRCCSCLFNRSRGFPYRDCRLSLTFRCSTGVGSLCIQCFRVGTSVFVLRGAVRVLCVVTVLFVFCSCALTL
jgi:hypothetical protein